MTYIISNAYHGTDTIFEQFICPAYFAQSYQTASFFSNRGKNKGFVVNCSIVFYNPLIVDLQSQSWGGFFLKDEELQEKCIKYISEGNLEEESYFREDGITLGYLADYAIYMGYDGIIAYNCTEENNVTETQYVVFTPQNITKCSDDLSYL